MDQITSNEADAGSVVTEYVYITRQGAVRGGNPIVAGTRIGVHDVVGLLQNAKPLTV